MGKVIGLTGSIAAGKSSVVEEFRRQGAAVLDCDKVVAALYENELVPVFQEKFPETIEDGKISKELIKQHILSDTEKFKELEAVVHPAVRQKAAEFIAANDGLVVLEIQMLFENDITKQPEYAIDATVAVTAPYNQRFERSKKSRPHIADADFERMNGYQMPEGEKAKRADFVIDNRDGTNPAQQVKDVIRGTKFFTAWRELAERLDFPEDKSEAFLKKVYAAYNGDNRHYHGVSHINYLIELAERYKGDIENYDDFLLATFLHDSIYEISREQTEKNSEELSADEADELADLGLQSHRIARVKEFVLATQKHQDSGDKEINLFLDMDLSILAAKPEAYDAYSRRTRDEYLSVYTPSEFAAGRAAFLKGMIERDSIFLTDAFRGYDDQAKNNMKRELKMYEREPMVGIYAGSFDPITRGHMGIICESINKLDKLVIGIGHNPSKAGWMSVEKRQALIESAIENFKNEVSGNPDATPAEKEAVRRIEGGLCEVVVEEYKGMTVDFAVKHNAKQLMRGLRPVGDFDSEIGLADGNRALAGARDFPVSTTFIPTPDNRYIFASSSLIRMLANEPKAIDKYLYPSTAAAVAEKVKADDRVKGSAQAK